VDKELFISQNNFRFSVVNHKSVDGKSCYMRGFVVIIFYLVPSGYIHYMYHPKILLPNVFLNFSFMNYYMLSSFVFYYAFYMNTIVVWLLLVSL